MADYRACDWPAPLTQKDCSVAKFMDEMNEKVLKEYANLCEDEATYQDWEELRKEIVKCKVRRCGATYEFFGRCSHRSGLSCRRKVKS